MQSLTAFLFCTLLAQVWLPSAVRKRRSAGDDSDGLTSFDQHTGVLEQCAQCGLRTRPLWIRAGVAQAASGQPQQQPQDILIVPLQSWYHSSWDREPDLFAAQPGRSKEDFASSWSDFHMCKWPEPFDCGQTDALAEHFALMNEPVITSLLGAMPKQQPSGRRQPPLRLDKEKTYARWDQTPYTPGKPLWSSIDTSTFFTQRATDAYLEAKQAEEDLALASAPDAAAAATAVDVSDGAAASAAPRRPFVLSLSHFVPRQELVRIRTRSNPCRARAHVVAPLGSLHR